MPYRPSNSTRGRPAPSAAADRQATARRSAADGAGDAPVGLRRRQAGRSRMADAPLRVLIVDDEAPARRRLRELLDDCAGALPLAIVGEAANGREALEILHAVSADLVLTDIHMPEMDGLELARHLLKLPQPPVVIFTTAYHEHALQAFDVNAVDYLMKPVRVQRLLAALQKVPRLKPVSATQLDELPATARRFLSVTERSRVVLVPDRRDRLPQGRAQVHHDPHGAARVPARGIADASSRRSSARASSASTATASSRATRSAASSAASATKATRTGKCVLKGVTGDASGVAPAAVRRPRDRPREPARRATPRATLPPARRRFRRVTLRAPCLARPLHGQPAHADLRFARLRHHHGVPRPLRAAHPARADARAVGVVPDRRDAPRMGRLRRQHRLQPARRSAASPS